MAASTDTQPTVVLLIEGSAIAFEESGEILETVEFDDSGKPIWTDASICDHRGVGGERGYQQLRTALESAEANARVLLADDQIVRVPRESVR